MRVCRQTRFSVPERNVYNSVVAAPVHLSKRPAIPSPPPYLPRQHTPMKQWDQTTHCGDANSSKNSFSFVSALRRLVCCEAAWSDGVRYNGDK